MAKKFYVVWSGRKTGIFTDWATTQKSISGFPNATFKSYPTRKEAEEAFGGRTFEKAKDKPRATNLKSNLAKNQFDLQIYCDGGCEPNPGKAASGVAVYRDGVVCELWYGLYNPKGTNNTAELNGLHQSLLIAQKEINNQKTVEILCDSMYAINCIANWATAWKKNGWKKKTGEIKNLKIIQVAHDLYSQIHLKIKLSHIKAHVGIEGNELADRMTMYGILKKDASFCLYEEKIDVNKILKMREG